MQQQQWQQVNKKHVMEVTSGGSSTKAVVVGIFGFQDSFNVIYSKAIRIRHTILDLESGLVIPLTNQHNFVIYQANCMRYDILFIYSQP